MAAVRTRRRRRYSVLRQARRVAQNYARRRSVRKTTIPLAVVAGFFPLSHGLWNRRSSMQAMGNFASASLVGYLPGQGFTSFYLKEGAFPIIAGIAAHKIAGLLGVNRLLGKHGIPLIRI